MKVIYQSLFCGLALLVGCADENKDERTRFDEFLLAVSDFSEEGAVSCGFTTPDMSSTHLITCVVDSFEANIPFYIFQQQNDNEYYVVNATAMSPQGNMVIWSYRGDQNSGDVSKEECSNPILKEVIINPTELAFECSNN